MDHFKKGTNLHFTAFYCIIACGTNVTRSDLGQAAGRRWDPTLRSNLEQNVFRSMPPFPSDPPIKGTGLCLTTVQHQIVSPYVLGENLHLLLKYCWRILYGFAQMMYSPMMLILSNLVILSHYFLAGGPWVSPAVQSWLMPSYLEEGHCGSVSNSPVLYLGLLCQIICWINGGFHPLHSQEGSQVGSIGWDYD